MIYNDISILSFIKRVHSTIRWTSNLIILHVISFEYTEGHHDPPLVTLFVVTELDLLRHDPDGMINDLQ